MSLSIWTLCGALTNSRALELGAWRTVEAQYVTSTRKLVDSDAEQELLERLLEEVKPALPSGYRFSGGALHYLLFTPFRHPPLPHGSRFGSRSEASIFYGSQELETSFAEVAYYRLLFLEGTDAGIDYIECPLTCFKVGVATPQGVDLRNGRFSAYQDILSSKTHYADTQLIGREMRADGIKACLYSSARTEGIGTNVALFEPAFSSSKPGLLEGWTCFITRAEVSFRKRNTFQGTSRTFLRPQFLVNGQLPSPSV